MEVHEPFVPTDDEQRFATHILTKAKGFAEAGDVQPMAFLMGDDPGHVLAILPLGQIFDDKARAAAIMRDACRKFKPSCFSFVSDSWVTKIDDYTGAAKAGLDLRKHTEWPQEVKDKFGLTKRQCLMVSVETKTRQFILTQFYRRDFRDRPIWEEVELMPGTFEGRFVGMLKAHQ
jgi:hypothetical protein